MGVYLLLRSTGVALLNLQVLSNSPLFYFTTIALPQILMIGIALHAIALAIVGYEEATQQLLAGTDPISLIPER